VVDNGMEQALLRRAAALSSTGSVLGRKKEEGSGSRLGGGERAKARVFPLASEWNSAGDPGAMWACVAFSLTRMRCCCVHASREFSYMSNLFLVYAGPGARG